MLQIHDISRTTPLPFAVSREEGVACQSCPVRKSSICGCDELGPSLIASISRRHVKPAKTILFDEGAHAGSVFNIIRGTVLLSRGSADGRRQVVGIAMPGDFLGLAMADSHAFTARALTELEFCRMDRERFSEALDEAPRLLRRLLAISANELTLAQDHMVLLGRRNAEERMAGFLLSLRDRHARSGSPSVRVDLPMTRQEIGDYLGLTLETVSRIFSKMAKKKLITIIPDGVRILDLAALFELAT